MKERETVTCTKINSTMTPVKDETQISTQMKRLYGTIDLIEDKLSSVIVKLNPVLFFNLYSDPSQENEAQIVPLAHDIRGLVDRLIYVHEKLDYISEHIEL